MSLVEDNWTSSSRQTLHQNPHVHHTHARQPSNSSLLAPPVPEGRLAHQTHHHSSSSSSSSPSLVLSPQQSISHQPSPHQLPSHQPSAHQLPSSYQLPSFPHPPPSLPLSSLPDGHRSNPTVTVSGEENLSGRRHRESSSSRQTRRSTHSWGVLPPDAPRSYTPVKLVGDGSFGTVWLCDWHSPLPPGTTLSPMQCGAGARPEWVGKRLVAVKRMKRVWERGWEDAAKLKELESLRFIPPHPNVIPLYDAFLQPSKELYFVFECMEGNLYQLTKSRRGRPMAGGLIASIFHQVISGLNHIHSAGYFHRDMKPENLLVTTIGLQDYIPVRETPLPPGTRTETDVIVIVKLADFGLAREIDSKPPYTEYVSTRWYRAPEVLLRSREYGPPVDIWALGTILAEIVNLKPIFPGQSEVDQVYKICAILGDPSRKYGLDEQGKIRGGGPWDRGIKMAHAVGFGFPKMSPPLFSSFFDASTPSTLIDCIAECLRYNPRHRITARACLEHAYFRQTVPQIQATPFIPAMPDAPPSSSNPSNADHQPYLPSAASSTNVASTIVETGIPSHPSSRTTPHSDHSPGPSVGPTNLPLSLVDGASASRTLPAPQASTNSLSPIPSRALFFPQYRDPTSPVVLPPSSSSSSISHHSAGPRAPYDQSPSLDHRSLTSSSLANGRRTTGASALVDQLKKLDLPAADLSSYGKRLPAHGLNPAPSWSTTPQPASPADVPSNHHQQPHHSQSQQHRHTHSNSQSYGQPAGEPSNGGYCKSTSGDPQLYALSNGSTSTANSSFYASSANVDLLSNPATLATSSLSVSSSTRGQVHQSIPPIQTRSETVPLPSPQPPSMVQPLKAHAPVTATATKAAPSATMTTAATGLPTVPAPKKKKWGGLASVFGGNNDSKHEHGLSSVGEEPATGPGVGPSGFAPSPSVPLKRTQSISNVTDASISSGDITLDPKTAQKEAKRQAKQYELAKREAASAAARERARAVMQKRDRLVEQEVSHKHAVKAGVIEKGEKHSEGTGYGQSPSVYGAHPPAGPSAPAHLTHANSFPQSSSNHSRSLSHLQPGVSSKDLLSRHKSRRRDGDDDHSTSSLGLGKGPSSFQSPSVLTFQSIDSDPGPARPPREYPSSLASGYSNGYGHGYGTDAYSVSSQGSTSSPQLYSLPHMSDSVESELVKNFKHRNRLGYSSVQSLASSSSRGSFDPYGRYSGAGAGTGAIDALSGSSLQLPSISSSNLSEREYINPMFQVGGPTADPSHSHSHPHSPHSNSHSSGRQFNTTALPSFSHIASFADNHHHQGTPSPPPPSS